MADLSASKRIVYFDVSNTVDSPFITGIQRVTREFYIAVNSYKSQLKLHYIPLVYHHGHWRYLSKQEESRLRTDSPRRTDLLSRIWNKFNRFLLSHWAKTIPSFPKDSIFLDIENSWHAKAGRHDLLPNLKSAGVRIVKLHYDLIPLLLPESTDPETALKFVAHLNAHLKYADLFLCISKTSMRDVHTHCQRHSIPPPHTRIIPLGSNFNSTQVASDDRSEFGRYLLMVGTLEPRKNHLLLLQAFDQISDQSDLNLVIVGKTGWLADAITERIQSHPLLGTRLFYLNAVSNERLAALYKNAWLNVAPSSYEGFGLPVTEALSFGCPTLCSNIEIYKEVAGDTVRYFNAGSVEDMTKQILFLKQSLDEYKSLRRRAKSFTPCRWIRLATSIDRKLINT